MLTHLSEDDAVGAADLLDSELLGEAELVGPGRLDSHQRSRTGRSAEPPQIELRRYPAGQCARAQSWHEYVSDLYKPLSSRGCACMGRHGPSHRIVPYSPLRACMVKAVKSADVRQA